MDSGVCSPTIFRCSDQARQLSPHDKGLLVLTIGRGFVVTASSDNDAPLAALGWPREGGDIRSFGPSPKISDHHKVHLKSCELLSVKILNLLLRLRNVVTK